METVDRSAGDRTGNAALGLNEIRNILKCSLRCVMLCVNMFIFRNVVFHENEQVAHIRLLIVCSIYGYLLVY